MEIKRRIRKSILKKRDEMPKGERAEKSRNIMDKITRMDIYQEAESILCYVNYKSEVETEEFIKETLSRGKKVYCPRIDREEMEFYRIAGMEDLSMGYMGIREPMPSGQRLLCGRDISMERCLMIMPGSVFDRERNRMGYGKGYYDRYLERYPQLPTVAVCFECQLAQKVPTEEHDRKPNMVITEENIY